MSQAGAIDKEASMKLSASHSEVSLDEGKKLTETEDYEEDSGNKDGPRLRPKFDVSV